MGLHAHGDRPAIFGDINITPLTDIFLVLLIIMMVVAPMMNSGEEVQLPTINSGQSVEQGKMAIEVSKEGNFYMQGQAITAADLPAELKSVISQIKDKNLIIRADKNTKSGTVLKVLEAARDAGYEKVTVSGEPLSPERQRELKAGA
ncbi:MAG: biopolymer transporter ExbD [Vampirovibrionales bacterium]|nr:biopolymer transporter ExbD [Vampirovibrionales bacterium]